MTAGTRSLRAGGNNSSTNSSTVVGKRKSTNEQSSSSLSDDYYRRYNVQPLIADVQLSPRTAKWVKELTPVLEPYNFNLNDISDLVHRCHYDVGQIELAVGNVIEDFSGHESGQWTKVGKNKSNSNNNKTNESRKQYLNLSNTGYNSSGKNRNLVGGNIVGMANNQHQGGNRSQRQHSQNNHGIGSIGNAHNHSHVQNQNESSFNNKSVGGRHTNQKVSGSNHQNNKDSKHSVNNMLNSVASSVTNKGNLNSNLFVDKGGVESMNNSKLNNNDTVSSMTPNSTLVNNTTWAKLACKNNGKNDNVKTVIAGKNTNNKVVTSTKAISTNSTAGNNTSTAASISNTASVNNRMGTNSSDINYKDNPYRVGTTKDSQAVQISRIDGSNTESSRIIETIWRNASDQRIEGNKEREDVAVSSDSSSSTVSGSGLDLGIKVGGISSNGIQIGGIMVGELSSPLLDKSSGLGVYLPDGRTIDPNANEGLLFGSFGAVDVSKVSEGQIHTDNGNLLNNQSHTTSGTFESSNIINATNNNGIGLSTNSGINGTSMGAGVSGGHGIGVGVAGVGGGIVGISSGNLSASGVIGGGGYGGIQGSVMSVYSDGNGNVTGTGPVNAWNTGTTVGGVNGPSSPSKDTGLQTGVGVGGSVVIGLGGSNNNSSNNNSIIGNSNNIAVDQTVLHQSHRGTASNSHLGAHHTALKVSNSNTANTGYMGQHSSAVSTGVVGSGGYGGLPMQPGIGGNNHLSIAMSPNPSNSSVPSSTSSSSAGSGSASGTGYLSNPGLMGTYDSIVGSVGGNGVNNIALTTGGGNPYNYAYLNYAGYTTAPNFPYMVGNTAAFGFPHYSATQTTKANGNHPTNVFNHQYSQGHHGTGGANVGVYSNSIVSDDITSGFGGSAVSGNGNNNSTNNNNGNNSGNNSNSNTNNNNSNNNNSSNNNNNNNHNNSNSNNNNSNNNSGTGISSTIQTCNGSTQSPLTAATINTSGVHNQHYYHNQGGYPGIQSIISPNITQHQHISGLGSSQQQGVGNVSISGSGSNSGNSIIGSSAGGTPISIPVVGFNGMTTVNGGVGGNDFGMDQAVVPQGVFPSQNIGGMALNTANKLDGTNTGGIHTVEYIHHHMGSHHHHQGFGAANHHHQLQNQTHNQSQSHIHHHNIHVGGGGHQGLIIGSSSNNSVQNASNSGQGSSTGTGSSGISQTGVNSNSGTVNSSGIVANHVVGNNATGGGSVGAGNKTGGHTAGHYHNHKHHHSETGAVGFSGFHSSRTHGNNHSSNNSGAGNGNNNGTAGGNSSGSSIGGIAGSGKRTEAGGFLQQSNNMWNN
ncbi:hypothetical protein FG379_000818 [Cryptosporidium bovis]|uniref:uncharacterized protein n=1 Tax=Cryptosporidium bovis TaxID=310047 RepID=UPI00351A1649|nr:hypothetical protein FG379_000818 [Cryptosporidium bovis]